MDSLRQVRVQVVRLERYCQRTKDRVWSGNYRDLCNALADCAEAAEIARRLYLLIETAVQQQPHGKQIAHSGQFTGSDP